MLNSVSSTPLMLCRQLMPSSQQEHAFNVQVFDAFKSQQYDAFFCCENGVVILNVSE